MALCARAVDVTTHCAVTFDFWTPRTVLLPANLLELMCVGTLGPILIFFIEIQKMAYNFNYVTT